MDHTVFHEWLIKQTNFDKTLTGTQRYFCTYDRNVLIPSFSGLTFFAKLLSAWHYFQQRRRVDTCMHQQQHPQKPDHLQEETRHFSLMVKLMRWNATSWWSCWILANGRNGLNKPEAREGRKEKGSQRSSINFFFVLALDELSNWVSFASFCRCTCWNH